ncbi:MAG TPA: YafY family protein [Acidimicrobiales bacterium]|nr:YafY family protein [Acidimicrobiales bacterium]
MRADRLVAILLMLQQKGQVTAAEVAVELEVSERTARRDLEALGMAGLPVFSLQGRNGGWRLAGGGRTDLSGLSAAEVRALFLVVGPSASATPEVRAALRKLVRALPESFRSQAAAALTTIVVDGRGWHDTPAGRPVPTFLDAVQRAVIGGEELALGYVDRDGAPTVREVHPLGLAAKGSSWYLVADTAAGRRTFRVDRVTSADPTGRPALRPDDFDLAATWQGITTEVDRLRYPVAVAATLHPDWLDLCHWVFWSRVRIGPSGPSGLVAVEIRGRSERSLIGELAGFGAGIEVLSPEGVRHGLGRLGRELGALYRAGADQSGRD